MTTRLLVVGLDGATLDLIEPWVQAGHLPNLAALIKHGAHGPLRSTLPAMTLPAWSTFLTGCNPGRHGLFDFTRHVHGQYAVQFVNATHRKEPTFLRRLSHAGMRVVSLGVPTTYPPEPINGALIAGFDSPVSTNPDASFVYPPELYNELNRTTGQFPLTDFQEVRIGRGWHREALKKLGSAVKGQTRVARYLLDREAWDCFVVVFGASDTVAHHFWAFHDPNSPRYDAAGAREFGDAILSIYKQLDAAIGDLHISAGPDVDLIVLSDHGFGGTSDKAISINRYLDQCALFNFKSERGMLARGAHVVKQAGLRLLPANVQQRIFRSWPRVVNTLESGARYGHIDWSHTSAYSEELNYFPSVWLNVRGREACGIIDAHDYDSVREHVIEALYNWRDEESGQYIVKHAYPREQVYQGNMLHDAPDIILELALDQGYSYAIESTRTRGNSLRRMMPHEYIGAKGRSMNGSHRRDGILIASGPSFMRQRIKNATLADIAPTLLTLLGLPSQEMDGRIMRELLVGNRTPVDISRLNWTPQPTLNYSLSDEVALNARLRSLGYIE